MKRLVWHGNQSLKIEHLPGSPPHPRENEVLLEVRAVGICGTDIHILKGTHPNTSPPLVLGHEISGEIVEIGKNVGRIRNGDRVTVDAVVGCGQCNFCRRGRRQFCANGFELGITRDGGCQDYLIVPKKNAYCIPSTVSFEEAAILDMEVYNAIRKCRVETGDAILILGAGSIGLIACQVARILGADHIVLADVLKGRLDTAEAQGIADAYLSISGNGSPTGTGDEYSGTFDLVIDCAGTSDSTQHALKAVRPGGRVLLYGVHEHAIDQLDLNQIVLKDLVLFGAQSDRSGWEDVIGLVASGALDLKSLITHRFALEEGPRAYDLVRKREDAVIKAVLIL
jgi:2-desacetyl-2-hydroxyethyl bacteriochlorophyllide A dehydrogenase